MSSDRVVAAVPTLLLPSGEEIPILGQGTWRMAEDRRKRRAEIEALRDGMDLGLTLIDTAEMYADGGAEILVGEAIEGRRDEVFLVTKILPRNATRRGTVEACERSLQRLRTDRIDLYLLHWREKVPLQEALEGFAALKRAGKIRYWGVSNFDVADMEELVALGGETVQTDQVLFNVGRRGIEYDLLPWCREHRIPAMAYSPIEQGRLVQDPTMNRIAKRHHATPAQIALAWMLRGRRVCAIPKAGTPAHVRENRRALEIRLTPEDLALIERAFPPPREPCPLEMI